MPVFFESAADVMVRVTYNKKMKAAVQKALRREQFSYYGQFSFTGSPPGPVFIPGTLAGPVGKEVAAKGKAPARGFFTYAAETGVSLVVTSGKVEPDKIAKLLSTAGLSCKVTAGEATGTDKELEAMTDGGTVAKKKAEFGDKLSAHLASKTADDREAHARTALEMGERITNAEKTGDQPHAHSFTAHGPGTDQVPRIVGGYRADQVDEMAKGGTLPKGKVALAKEGTAARTVPKFTKVGDDPSNVSSQFGSAVAMQSAVEEAFAQAALLQSRIAAEVKATTDDRTVLEVAEVKVALKTLVDARKAYDGAKARLGEASKKKGNLKEALTALDTLKTELETAITGFQAAKKTAMDARPKQVPSTAADGRMGITVEPGMAMGTTYQTTADKLPGEDAENPNVARPLSEETIKDRYAKMTTTEGVPTAKVVLDPAFVTDKSGQKRRAGWQAQTAFPTERDPSEPAQRGLSEGQFAVLREQEQSKAAEAEVTKKNTEREALATQEKLDITTKKEAELAFEKANAPIFEHNPENDPPLTAEVQKASDEAELALENAKKALVDTRAALKNKGDEWNAAKRTRDAAQVKVVEAAEKVVGETKAELGKIVAAFKVADKAQKSAQATVDTTPSAEAQKILDVAKTKVARIRVAGKAAKDAVTTAEAALEAEKKKLPK